MPITLNGDSGISNVSWTTGTRPASPVTGQMGYNTTTGQLEVFNTIGGWVNAGTAGILYPANYLVVAGGGGGGGATSGSIRSGAGGGAGGFRTSFGTSGGGSSAESPLTLAKGTTYTITVGAGGVFRTNGSNSVF